MQVKKSAVVGVLITLYLSTGYWCHYIPEKKTATSENKKIENSTKIQICGNALTALIIETCDGIVSSLNQVNLSRDSVQTKITEDCCDQQCPLEYLENYCGETPLFINKKSKGKIFEKLGLGLGLRNNQAKSEGKKKKKSPAEVRGKFKKKGKRRKKRKRSFKWKCAFKSFGHYLLKLDRSNKENRNNQNQNNINRSWPSIEIGTVSPEIDQFGGQPIVMLKKTKSNAI